MKIKSEFSTERYKKYYLPRLILFRKSDIGLGLTQAELAEDIGCTRANISKFEKGFTLSGKILTYYLTHGLPEFWNRMDELTGRLR